MVHSHLVTTNPDPLDTTEDCVADRGSINRNEIRSLVGWRYWLGNGENSVVADQYYGAAPGH